MFKYFGLILISLLFNQTLLSMDKKPYHHLPDGTFRNPEGSPKRDNNVKWSYKIFNAERKKIKINFPSEHVIPRNEVLKSLQENKGSVIIVVLPSLIRKVACPIQAI